jgi:pimeloyl-ACP methyl ester carboxylesterase
MTVMEDTLRICGKTLEFRRIKGRQPGMPELVFLHEGLGSISLWRDFPERLAAELGAPALLYSRNGYGQSAAPEPPFRRGADYLHTEAQEVLPKVLDHFGIQRPILIGHSDGASIALIFAATMNRRPRALVLEAPHTFVEDITIAGIREAVTVWHNSDLPAKLGRHHRDPEGTFRTWYQTWLTPSFKRWSIESLLPEITCPVLVIQGEDDQYGTAAQIRSIENSVSGGVESRMLPACGHTPHRDQTEAALAEMVRFLRPRLAVA